MLNVRLTHSHDEVIKFIPVEVPGVEEAGRVLAIAKGINRRGQTRRDFNSHGGLMLREGVGDEHLVPARDLAGEF